MSKSNIVKFPDNASRRVPTRRPRKQQPKQTAVTAAASPVPAAPDDDGEAKLIMLGQQLRVVSEAADKMKPDRPYQAALKAADFAAANEIGQNDEAHRRFVQMAETNGYFTASKKWNAICDVEHKIARAILRIPSHSRIGDGVRAFATLIEDAGVTDGAVEFFLWEMAARAGFQAPPDIRRRLKRRGVVTA